MVWRIKIEWKSESNSYLDIKENFSIPTFLKIQVSDFYTLIPLMIHTYNHNELQAADAYFWLVFKTTNGEYLGKYNINYDSSVYQYRMSIFRTGMNEVFA